MARSTPAKFEEKRPTSPADTRTLAPARRRKSRRIIGRPVRSESRRSKLTRGAREFGYRCAQRFLDIAVSAVVLAITLPLVILIAILIKRDSRGPVLFKHVRLGRGRKPFTLFKFRTMYADAQERFPELYRYEYSEQELQSLPIKVLVGKKFGADRVDGDVANAEGMIDDPRITPMGHWLRRTSLDEFPNFINVLKGDMTLVGPRPDIAENVRYYLPSHLRKFDVKPGVTGLAQVSGRGELLFHETNKFDVEYVDHRTLLLDVKILLATAWKCVKKEGAF